MRYSNTENVYALKILVLDTLRKWFLVLVFDSLLAKLRQLHVDHLAR